MRLRESEISRKWVFRIIRMFSSNFSGENGGSRKWESEGVRFPNIVYFEKVSIQEKKLSDGIMGLRADGIFRKGGFR